MKVSIFNKQKTLPIKKREVAQIVSIVLSYERVLCDEVAIYFVQKKEIAILHKKFFNDPSPTDCITFPIDPPKSKEQEFCFLGEIFICSDTALEYASSHHIDPLEEQRLYLVHGLLHLSGYKDQTQAERRSMRKKEKNCMNMITNYLRNKADDSA